MDPIEIDRETFLRQLQAIQAQMNRENGPFMNGVDQPLAWESRIGPERRYGAFGFRASINSKGGIRSLCDALCVTIICTIAGLLMSLGFILYIKPLVYLILCWMFGFKHPGNEYVFSLFLVIKSGIAIAITLIDHFAPEAPDSIWQSLKGLLIWVEEIMTSTLTAIVLGASAFQCNIINPNARHYYCHPMLLGAVIFDIIFQLVVHIGTQISGFVGENYSTYFFYRLAVGVIKSMLRTCPIKPNVEAALVGLTQQFKQLYQGDEGLKNMLGPNVERDMNDIIVLIRCRAD